MKVQIPRELKQAAIDKLLDNLPALRAMCHYSQEDLAELIGLSRQTVAMIESKKRGMSWSVFLSMMFVFSQSEATSKLLDILQIYSDELKEFYT